MPRRGPRRGVVYARLTEQDVAALDRIAARYGEKVTRSDVIRAAVQQLIAQEKEDR